MADFFAISGYWKDDKTEFEDLIVYEYDDTPDETEPYSDDDIFFYGLSAGNLYALKSVGEDTMHDFVITSYTKII